ncbi:putative proteasome subunit beta type-5 [Nosema granulosis]|uniref:Proteasome subunit beta n=1 Tax=Nosema granulosis TaxID=83296 RepID=A0A9P6KZX1_9MICR|nr:putative proteasome subunit beta type-5 [Nosema granulosis]
MEHLLKKDISKIEQTHVNAGFIKHIKPFKGTTTLAFKFKEGMVIAVDSRASAGSYIASQTVHKVIKVNKHLLGTMAGGAADCYYWEKLMGLKAKEYELMNDKRISVSAASMYLSDCVYNYKGRGLSLGSMVCGYDGDTPMIYYVDNDGMRVSGDLFSVGSGSTVAYGILNDKYRFDLSKEEALDVAKKAIFHAAHRDAYSGGSVNLYFMDKNGWDFVGSYDVDSFIAEE